MRYLYKGKTKIGKIHMKTKVDTSFITAGPEDIISGKKSINSDYEEITGTMDPNEVLTELTKDATASASDITAGKNAWVNGKRLTGTTARTIYPLLMPDVLLDSYRVNSNTNISAGDFVTVKRVSLETVQHNPGVSQFIDIPDVDSTSLSYNLIDLSENTVLLIHRGGGIQCRIIHIDGINVTTDAAIVFTGLAHNITATKLTDNKILVVYGNSNNSVCRILTINSTYSRITASEEFIFHNQQSTLYNINKISDNKAVIFYTESNENPQLYSIVVTVQNNTLSYSSPSLIGSGLVTLLSSSLIKDNKIVLVHNENGTGHIRILQIDQNNKLILESDSVFGSYQIDEINLVKLSDTKFIMLYREFSSLDINLTIFYYTTFLSFSKSYKNRYGVISPTSIMLTHNKIITLYTASNNNDNIPSGTLAFIVTEIDAIDNISQGMAFYMTDHTFPLFESLLKINENNVLVAFTDTDTEPGDGNNTPNKYLMGMLQVDGVFVSNTFGEYTTKTEYMVNKYITGEEIHGIANTSGSSGEMIEVILPHVN